MKQSSWTFRWPAAAGSSSERRRPLGRARFFWLSALAFLFCASPWSAATAHADISSQEAAMAAHGVVSEHCADVVSAETTLASASVAAVSAVWQQVSEAYDREQSSYLLYWRGVLAQCLGYPERAEGDLQGFLAEAAADTEFGGLVSDARRRLRILSRKMGRSTGPPAPRVAGVAMLGSAAVFGAVAAVRGARVREIDQTLYGAIHTPAERDELVGQRTPAAHQANALGGTAIGCSVGGLFLLIAAARTAGGQAGRRLPMILPRAEVALTPGGVRGLQLGLEGSW